MTDQTPQNTDIDWRDKPHTHGGTDCGGGSDCPARSAETAQQRRARWWAEQDAARRTPGHVFSICQRCGEAWPVACAPSCCRRCESTEVVSTRPCQGCEHCLTTPGRPTEPEETA